MFLSWVFLALQAFASSPLLLSLLEYVASGGLAFIFVFCGCRATKGFMMARLYLFVYTGTPIRYYEECGVGIGADGCFGPKGRVYGGS